MRTNLADRSTASSGGRTHQAKRSTSRATCAQARQTSAGQAAARVITSLDTWAGYRAICRLKCAKSTRKSSSTRLLWAEGGEHEAVTSTLARGAVARARRWARLPAGSDRSVTARLILPGKRDVEIRLRTADSGMAELTVFKCVGRRSRGAPYLHADRPRTVSTPLAPSTSGLGLIRDTSPAGGTTQSRTMCGRRHVPCALPLQLRP